MENKPTIGTEIVGPNGPIYLTEEPFLSVSRLDGLFYTVAAARDAHADYRVTWQTTFEKPRKVEWESPMVGMAQPGYDPYDRVLDFDYPGDNEIEYPLSERQKEGLWLLPRTKDETAAPAKWIITAQGKFK